MSTRALIFDVDGTLVDTEELHRRAFNQVFLDFKLGWKWTPELYVELLKFSGGPDRIAAYIQRLETTDSQKAYLQQILPMLHREKTQVYAELARDAAVQPRPGVARLIREALKSGVKVGLVSTSALPDVRGLISTALGEDVSGMLDPIVCAEHVAKRKPAPDLYLLALNMLRLPAEECVAFEDSANGLAAAKAAGIYTVVTPSRWTAIQNFKGADLLLSALGDPDRPLEAVEAAMIGGGGYLTLSDVQALHTGGPTATVAALRR